MFWVHTLCHITLSKVVNIVCLSAILKTVKCSLKSFPLLHARKTKARPVVENCRSPQHTDLGMRERRLPCKSIHHENNNNDNNNNKNNNNSKNDNNSSNDNVIMVVVIII